MWHRPAGSRSWSALSLRKGIVASSTVLVVAPLNAQVTEKGKSAAVVFQHEGCTKAGESAECRASYVVDAADGEVISITIHRTQPDDYLFTVAGVPLAPDPPIRNLDEGLPDKVLTQRHNARFGGYIITIRKKATSPKAELPEATLVIAVRTNEWNTMFGGGFTGTNLVGRAYALRDSTTKAATTTSEAVVETRLVRDEDREDDATYGAATFVHIFHTKHPSLAISFGLGLSLKDAASTSYYFGPSLRFGNRGALTLGAVLGPIKTLPGGLRENDIIKDRTAVGNSLNSAPSRTARRAFVALSYSFLGGGVEAINKPFAGGDTPNTPPTEPGRGASGDPKIELVAQPSSVSKGGEIKFTVKVSKLSATSEDSVKVALEFSPADAATAIPPLTIASISNGTGTVSANATINAAAKVRAGVTFAGRTVWSDSVSVSITK